MKAFAFLIAALLLPQAAHAQAGKALWFQNACPHPIRVYVRWTDPVKGDVMNGPWDRSPSEGAPTPLSFGSGTDKVFLRAGSPVYIYAKAMDGTDISWTGTVQGVQDGVTYYMKPATVRVENGMSLIRLTCVSDHARVIARANPHAPLPERQRYHSNIITYNDGTYRCEFWTPTNLALTIYPNGKVWAEYKSEHHYGNGKTVLSVSAFRNPDGQTELSTITASVSAENLDLPAGLSNRATLFIDGQSYPITVNSSARAPNADGIMISTIGVSLIGADGADTLARLEALGRARSIKVQVFHPNGAPYMTFDLINPGLDKFTPYLTRSNWTCIDPTQP